MPLLELVVTFDPNTEPIEGRIRVDGSERAFSGWVGLASAIESAMREPSRGAAAGEARA